MSRGKLCLLQSAIPILASSPTQTATRAHTRAHTYMLPFWHTHTHTRLTHPPCRWAPPRSPRRRRRPTVVRDVSATGARGGGGRGRAELNHGRRGARRRCRHPRPRPRRPAALCDPGARAAGLDPARRPVRAAVVAETVDTAGAWCTRGTQIPGPPAPFCLRPLPPTFPAVPSVPSFRSPPLRSLLRSSSSGCVACQTRPHSASTPAAPAHASPSPTPASGLYLLEWGVSGDAVPLQCLRPSHPSVCTVIVILLNKDFRFAFALLCHPSIAHPHPTPRPRPTAAAAAEGAAISAVPAVLAGEHAGRGPSLALAWTLQFGFGLGLQLN